jgi:hypothetical protein
MMETFLVDIIAITPNKVKKQGKNRERIELETIKPIVKNLKI